MTPPVVTFYRSYRMTNDPHPSAAPDRPRDPAGVHDSDFFDLMKAIKESMTKIMVLMQDHRPRTAFEMSGAMDIPPHLAHPYAMILGSAGYLTVDGARGMQFVYCLPEDLPPEADDADHNPDPRPRRPLGDQPSPAVLEAAQDCRDAMRDDLTIMENLDTFIVLLVELAHHAAKETPANEHMDYFLSLMAVRAPRLLAYAPYTT
jgi:hypothetical protein